MLVGGESIDRIVGRSRVRASDLVVLEPGGALHETSPVRRLEPERLPGDWPVEALAAGTDGWFSVVRVHHLGTRIEARHLTNPAVVAAQIMVDTRGDVQEVGRREAWDFLPSLLPLRAIGDTVLSLIHRGSNGSPRLVHLPAIQAFARYTAGVEEYGLSVTVLPDCRHVVLQSAHGGGTFAVWDALEGRLSADVEVHASYPMEFTSALSPSRTLWAASTDTLFEFDPMSWEVQFSARLRQGRTGSFVNWLSSVDGGKTVLIGWNRRQRTSPFYWAPSTGEVLALDTHSQTVERLARLPTWTSHALLRRERADLITETRGDEQEFWQVAVQPGPHSLFAPRRAHDRDWT